MRLPCCLQASKSIGTQTLPAQQTLRRPLQNIGNYNQTII